MTPLESPATSSELSFIVGAEAVGLAMLNAVARQQLDTIAASAVTVMGACEILGIAPAEVAKKTAAPASAADALGRAAGVGVVKAEAPAVAEATTEGAKAADGAIDVATQLIALATALSVQDAANYLRNVQTLNTAAMASNLLARSRGEEQAQSADALAVARAGMDHGMAQFQQVCQWSVETLRQVASLRVGEPVTQPGSSVADEDLLQATASALSDAVHNAVSAQQQANVTAQATTTMGVATLYSVDTAALGRAASKILDGESVPGVTTF